MTDPIAGLNAALADRYVVDRELGHGGMALVYLARDLKHERFVALKTLRPEIAMALGRERFLREIKLAARLQHPNILSVYDSGDAGGVLYYVMPFVEGESLRDRLDREPQLPLDDALQIAREVADALSYAHGHDVVHRDIKPENIMLSGGHAIVADFGIARAVSAAGGDKLTETGLAIGTPAYMSPEQAAGTGQVDRRSDIYSLGCVLYETLAGQPPFTGPTAQAIMARHSLDSVPRLRIVRETIPDALEAVINRALAKVPADRYATAAQFAEALAASSTGPVSPVTATRRPVPAQRWLGLPRGVAVGATVGAILVLGWATRSLWSGNARAGGIPGGLESRHIAVLYFDDLTPNRDAAYLADGLTEALIGELRRVPGLEVISKNGVAPYRASDAAPDSIARALGAGTLVRGSVEEAGGRYRISVRLIEGSSGADFRRASFEKPQGNLLEIRDSLAADVADFLRQRLGEEVRLRQEEAGTSSPNAWALVQQAEKARKDAATLGATDVAGAAARYAAADSLLDAAEQADRRWLEPVVQRAQLGYLRSRLEREPRKVAAWLQLGLGHAQRALDADPENPDALEARGTIRFARFSRGLEADPAAADRLVEAARVDLENATRLNRGQVGAWNVLSVLYYQRRDLLEANRAARSAYEGDAYLAAADAILWRLFVTSYDLEMFPPAIDWCDKGRRRFPANRLFAHCQLMLMTSNAADPDVGLAWRLADEAVRLTPERDRPYQRLFEDIHVAAVLARAGRADSARHVLDRSKGDRQVDPQRELLGYEAFVRTMLGDKDEALRLLDEYLVANPKHREGFRKIVHWWWRPLQDDPRFKALIGAR